MYHLSLRSAGHIRHYSITTATPSGWDVRLEEDRELRRADRYHDWHRVERALAQFEREAYDLQASGWLISAQSMKR